MRLPAQIKIVQLALVHAANKIARITSDLPVDLDTLEKAKIADSYILGVQDGLSFAQGNSSSEELNSIFQAGIYEAMSTMSDEDRAAFELTLNKLLRGNQ